MISKEFFNTLDILEQEKGISKELILDAIEQGIKNAYRRNFGVEQVRVDIRPEKKQIRVFRQLEVVANHDEIEDENAQIALEDAREFRKSAKVGKIVEREIAPKEFGRIAVQTAKQIVANKLRETTREMIYDDFRDKELEIVTGTASRKDNRALYVNLGKIDGMLPFTQTIPGEKILAHMKMRVLITKVEQTTKGPRIYLSRTHPTLIKRLMEIEIPEIYDGTVEIVNIVREAGDKAKVSVRSTDENVDAIGTCLGSGGMRINTVMSKINNEKIELIRHSDDIKTYIAESLSPAKVVGVKFNEEENSAIAIVEDSQLSLAIGKQGQNVRIAAKLVGVKIDIKSVEEARELGMRV